MAPRILIAGIGNIFLSDDAFGIEVVRRLADENFPQTVRVDDYGVRGLHLAYDLLDGAYSMVILIDAAPRGGTPGTVYLVEPDFESLDDAQPVGGHAMTPEAVLAAVKALDGKPGRVLIVGCEPASVEEGIGLSRPVALAVEEAVRMVHEIVERELVSQHAPAGG